MSATPFSNCDDYTTVAQTVEPVHAPPSATPNPQKRTDPFQFGSRYLEEGDDVFSHNAWDHVEVDADYLEFAELQYEKQRASPVSDFDRHRFNTNPAKWWNHFYKNNTNNFFKDRKWLQQEFPVLADVTKPDAGRKVVLEIGAGAGNTAFPILANNENKQLMVHACDYSKTAVEVMRKSEHYNEQHIKADVWDVTAEGEDSLPPGLGEESVDVVVLVFILSALAPAEWARAVSNVYRVLKPGGLVLFRDYGRGDLAQVRFKKSRWMAENFYARGDGTRVYFFDRDELVHIWGQWSPDQGIPEYNPDPAKSTTDINAVGQKFDIMNLGIDRRLIVNRQRKLKMHRVWLQGRFQKKMTDSNTGNEHNEASTQR